MIKHGTSKRSQKDVDKQEKHESLSRRQRLRHIYDNESINEIRYVSEDETEDILEIT